MSFDVAAQAYDRFMGHWSALLAPEFAALADVGPGERVLDVGCGPGALTAVLVDRYGVERVSAVDPSEPFVEAARERLPGVDVRRAGATALPYGDGSFGAVLAQLVVHFLPDPVAGIRELARVTRDTGTVAACVWDFGTGRAPLSPFWTAVTALDPTATDESHLPGAAPGGLVDLFSAAGLTDVVGSTLTVRLEFADFAQWWEPFTLGVGPAGAYVAALSPDARDALRDECRRSLPPAPFALDGVVWTATGRAQPSTS